MADDLFKVVIIGDSGVGKTNLMTRYTANEFSTETASTIGVEFMTNEVKVNGRNVKVQIWDTAGQERFRAISRSIYHGAKGAIVVYDITSQQSFDNVSMWLQELKVHVHASTHIFLVGNKCDMEHVRQVRRETADAFARQHGMSFMETSAKDDVNVGRVFEMLVKSMHEAVMANAAKAPAGGVAKGSAAAPFVPVANATPAKPASTGGCPSC
jgi:Ras-related protein Rab-11A